MIPSLSARGLALIASAVLLATVVTAPLGAAPSWTEALAGPTVEAGEATSEDADAEKHDEKKEKWDVNEPPYPTVEVEIDTTEGTWMSVDVSPDGREIVFDLLGDIYAVPIEGGEATALTDEIAWNMQPRYSPDGRSIAFTSDRGGGDNLWTMDRDGSNPRPVTEESFRLLNSPAWTPDGEFVAGRKHFTSRRSLGAGEIWLYHRSGGQGVQMIERPNDQKDLGEPSFSPDGRYLYFSQDVTPGAIFEYNKDPNTEIYAIQRLDRETGKLEKLLGGPGGAIRPTPSPDGKRIAYIRRVRYQTVLQVHDLESGRERPIYHDLDRDMQETWAVHGVYPTMAWTPDGRSIVFWAGGKIRRIDIDTEEVAEIPFRVRATKRVAQALRFPQEVAPEEFPVRMLRWVRVSPDGRRVVYQALGHLWIRDLPDGAPRRLTRQTDHFELYPSFSRDGRSIVYTTWNDEDLGTIRIAPAGGGEGRVVTDRPGHYHEPVFTPDGRQIVYRRGSGGFLTSPLWSRDTGIHRVPAAGGPSTLVTERGSRPHFGAESDRVYLFRTDGDSRRLVSMDLHGAEERTHATSDNAIELQVSPDGRWLAFQEMFNAYVVPFVRTGKPLAVGPQMKALPAARASRDAGDYLHWSGDSRILYWALGGELFERELTQVFSFLEGAPEELPDPPEEGLRIGFDTRADVPSGRVALVGGRIVTMREDEILDDGTILVERNRIVAVGRRGEVEIPAGAHVLDVSGTTILPGFVDVHWHGAQASDSITPQRNWFNYASLAFGVTTIHDPSHSTANIFAASEMARAGLITAPRLFSTGTILYGAAAPFTAKIDSLDDARSHLRRMKAVGAFSVKSYNQPRRDQRQQVIQAGRELEMLVVPEGGSLFQHNMSMIVDGHTGIEHAVPNARMYDDVYQLWPATGVGYTPTLSVAYGGLWGENYWYAHTNVWENERLLNLVPRRLVDARARRPVLAPEEEYNHIEIARQAGELARRGVIATIGAHGQREGLAAHWEVWMYVQGGLTPHEALRRATLDGARYLGMDAEIGSLEPGKLADLMVLDRDPLENIRNSESLRYVMVNGRIYDAWTLDQLGNHPEKRGTFSWEE